VILGGLAGGAAATVIEGRTPGDLVAISPAPTSLPTAAAASVPAGADTIVDAVRELLPSVVTVVNRAPNGQAQSSGSGFVIDAQQGYIATNNHVVENGRGGVGASFDVIFYDNRTVKATLVGRDVQTDIAVRSRTRRRRPLARRSSRSAARSVSFRTRSRRASSPRRGAACRRAPT
jgi:S1-C subfamily serine protease